MLALLIVLSLGSGCDLGGHRVGLPSGWLREHFFGFRLIRVPARINLFVGVIAAVLAGAAFGEILKRLPWRPARVALFAAVTAIAIYDLAIPVGPAPMPPQPACYAAILKGDPGASFLEAPQCPSGGWFLNACTGYWQSLHQGRSSGGYSGHANAEYDRRVLTPSPFYSERMADPNYLASPEEQAIDLIQKTRFREYTWLYMTAHQFRYAVLHRWPGATPEYPKLRIDRVRGQLIDAQVYEDSSTVGSSTATVFPSPRIRRSSAPRAGGLGEHREGFRYRVGRSPARGVQPDPGRRPHVRGDGRGLPPDPGCTQTAAGREVARWTLSTGEPRLYLTPPFRLPRGLSELVIESDGAEEPRGTNEPPNGDRRPFSLRVTGISFGPALEGK